MPKPTRLITHDEVRSRASGITLMHDRTYNTPSPVNILLDQRLGHEGPIRVHGVPAMISDTVLMFTFGTVENWLAHMLWAETGLTKMLVEGE
jgi:hypothetical protein